MSVLDPFEKAVLQIKRERGVGLPKKNKDDFFGWNQDFEKQLPDLYPFFHTGCALTQVGLVSVVKAIELAPNPEYSRYDRMYNIAQAYTDGYALRDEEMKAFFEKGERQAEQYNLQAFKQELHKIKDYYNYWHNIAKKWRFGLLDRMVENFSDEEIEQTLEPMIYDRLNRSFFLSKVNGRDCKFSVAYNLGDTGRTQNVLDANMESFRNGSKLARQAWAEELGVSYEEANQLAAMQPANNEPTKVSHLLATYGTHEEYEARKARETQSYKAGNQAESNQDSNKESIDKFINNNCETELPMDFEAQESLNSRSCEPSQLSDSDSVTSELDDEHRVTKANPGLPKLGLFANSQNTEEHDSLDYNDVDDRQFNEPGTPV